MRSDDVDTGRPRYRSLAVALGIAAAVLLLWMVNPWVAVPDQLGGIVTVAFWVLAIALLAVLYLIARSAAGSGEVQIEGPAFARFLFNNSAAGLFWLPVRIFLGFSWLEGGWHHLTDPAWTTNGGALRVYWENAVRIPEQGRPSISFEWYRDFINVLLTGHHEAWFAWVIAFGEIFVGLGLLFGALTGIAAFFGALMNMSFLLAGSASTNPVLFTFAIGLILAWRVAGYYGVDRWLLPLLGTPWRPGFRLGVAAQQPNLDASRREAGPTQT
jgi:thiosulfate dehydrogenase (quinone) large subunit